MSAKEQCDKRDEDACDWPACGCDPKPDAPVCVGQVVPKDCPTCGGDGKLTDQPGTFKACSTCGGCGKVVPFGNRQIRADYAPSHALENAEPGCPHGMQTGGTPKAPCALCEADRLAASVPSTTPQKPIAWRYRTQNSIFQWSMWTVVSEHPGPSEYTQEIVPLYEHHASTASATRERAALASIAANLPHGEHLLNECLGGLGLELCKGTYVAKRNSFSSRWKCECGGNIGNCPAQKRAADGGKA